MPSRLGCFAVVAASWLVACSAPAAAQCRAGSSPGTVQSPQLVRNLPGTVAWFGSPLAVDLDGDGRRELVSSGYGLMVHDAQGALLHETGPRGFSRIFAPIVVADLESDGIVEIVAGQPEQLLVFEWRGSLVAKPGWPARIQPEGTTTMREVRGLTAGDLDGDGTLELVVTTTTGAAGEDRAYVHVFSADGSVYQPSGGHAPAWPRYNHLSGAANDADRNGEGHHASGTYGLNPAIGNLDDDPELEIVVTFDNRTIQVFDHDGVALDASSHFSDPASGAPVTWGQLQRWLDPDVEEALYYLRPPRWPESHEELLNWATSPPVVVDLDGDGRNEIVAAGGILTNEATPLRAFAVLAVESEQGDRARAARRKPGWEVPPEGEPHIALGPHLGWLPAVVAVDLTGDGKREVVAPLNDGFVHAFAPNGTGIWKVDVRNGNHKRVAGEPAIADLNQDGIPEVIVTTFGELTDLGAGRLFVISATGDVLINLALPDPVAENGIGIGGAAAPTVTDLDGDGRLELLVATLDHGVDVFTVPGSSPNCVQWSTSRGGPLRQGRPQVLAALPAEVDETPPTVPSLSASVKLRWIEASDGGGAGIAHYELRREGGTSGVLVRETNGTSFTDDATRAGESYTYSVRAVDAVGNASAWSTSVFATFGSGGSGGQSGKTNRKKK